MANAINHASIFSQILDAKVAQHLTSQVLEAQNELIRYSGGKDVKIAKLALSGLANYDRSNGFAKGNVSLEWETHTFSQDRGRRFDVDVMDEDEAAFVPTASVVLANFAKTQTVPEVDSYRYSKIAKKAHSLNQFTTESLTKSNVYEKITDGISKALDKGYIAEELVVFVSYPVYNLLINSADLQKLIVVDKRNSSGVETRIYSINGVEIVPVTSDRMKSGYTFADGEAGGFTALEGAVAVNYLVVPRKAALAIVKHNVSKVIPPELNQTSDGYIVAVRVYHDIFFQENASVGLYASFASAPGSGAFGE